MKVKKSHIYLVSGLLCIVALLFTTYPNKPKEIVKLNKSISVKEKAFNINKSKQKTYKSQDRSKVADGMDVITDGAIYKIRFSNTKTILGYTFHNEKDAIAKTWSFWDSNTKMKIDKNKHWEVIK